MYLRGHSLRGKPKSDEHRAKLSVSATGRPGVWLGRKMSEVSRKKMSAAKAGKKLSPEHKAKIAAKMKGQPHPSIHHKQSIETRIKKSLAQRGRLGSNWKGGVSQANRIARSSIEFKEWRAAVFARDCFTCQHCSAHTGSGRRVELHPHHIKSFALFPGLRFEVSNGLTLCKACHKKEHHPNV